MINVIASRYAEALFQVGEEINNTENLYEELTQIVDVMDSNKELNGVLRSPLVAKEDKKELIEKIFEGQLSPNMNNFLKIVIDKDRISIASEIKANFKQLLNEKNNVVEGIVTTAVVMEESEIKALEEKLSKKYSKNIALTNIVDETILGGVLVRLGNEEIDGTVKTRLDKMKETLSQVIS